MAPPFLACATALPDVQMQVLRLMDKLEPRDLGMSEDDFGGLRHSLCVPVVAGGSEEAFEMTVFVLPKGGKIPLHDHPNSEWRGCWTCCSPPAIIGPRGAFSPIKPLMKRVCR